MEEQYIEIELYHIPLPERRRMQAWCCEVLGYDAGEMSDWPCLYFKTMEDATMFVLRWQSAS